MEDVVYLNRDQSKRVNGLPDRVKRKGSLPIRGFATQKTFDFVFILSPSVHCIPGVFVRQFLTRSQRRPTQRAIVDQVSRPSGSRQSLRYQSRCTTLWKIGCPLDNIECESVGRRVDEPPRLASQK